MTILKISLLIMCMLSFRMLYISIKDKRQRIISTLLTCIILFVITKYQYYELLTNWLRNVWNDFTNDISDWYTGIFYWIILAIMASWVTYIICMCIAFLWDKDKVNQQRDISFATLWLFWGIFGTIFWDTTKKIGEWKIEEVWLYIVFLLLFWWLTSYLSKQIK